jgi:hypothetical protein
VAPADGVTEWQALIEINHELDVAARRLADLADCG